jgi:hypothetical protein
MSDLAMAIYLKKLEGNSLRDRLDGVRVFALHVRTTHASRIGSNSFGDAVILWLGTLHVSACHLYTESCEVNVHECPRLQRGLLDIVCECSGRAPKQAVHCAGGVDCQRHHQARRFGRGNCTAYTQERRYFSDGERAQCCCKCSERGLPRSIIPGGGPPVVMSCSS